MCVYVCSFCCLIAQVFVCCGTHPLSLPTDDEIDNSVPDSDGAHPGGNSSTKGKGKFSSLGKIFKPWKWRKKKSSDKFKETSEGMCLIHDKKPNTAKNSKPVYLFLLILMLTFYYNITGLKWLEIFKCIISTSK